MRASWFLKIDDQMHQQAVALFEHVYATYSAEYPQPEADSSLSTPASTDESDFLSSIGSYPSNLFDEPSC